jgi:hypothetical protein
MNQFLAYATPVAIMALALALVLPALLPRTPDRCTLTLVEQDPDDHSTTETRARVNDGQ